MKHLYPTGYNHVCERSLQGNHTDENQASKQVKRNQTSERKIGHKTIIFHLFFLCHFLLFSSCKEQITNHFKSSDDALESYKEYHFSLKAINNMNSAEFSSQINHWQEVKDTVLNYLTKDPSYYAHVSQSMAFDSVSDSIRKEFIRLSNEYSMKDVALVKLNTSPFTNQQELILAKNEGMKFFSSLDYNLPYQNDNIEKQLESYQEFLHSYEDKREYTMDQVKSFIANEDLHFRSFLLNIDKFTDMGLTEITLLTEQICGNIYKEAYNGNIPQEEGLIYMSMRTARRLLMNAEACHKLLKVGKVKSPQQANAFLWMLIQPYLSMDVFTIAMLTEEQIALLLSMADGYDDIVTLLQTKQLVNEEVSNQFPEQLMQLYILTL